MLCDKCEELLKIVKPMENKLKVISDQGKTLYVYLYNYYDDGKPTVSFQSEEEPSWSPNPHCYYFDTFLEIEDRG